jgi:anti-repressor protein
VSRLAVRRNDGKTRGGIVNGLINLGDAAKSLNLPGFGQNKLFAFLRDQKVLTSDNKPYQKFINNGYFQLVKESFYVPYGRGKKFKKLYFKPVLTEKGMEYVRSIVPGACAEQGRIDL